MQGEPNKGEPMATETLKKLRNLTSASDQTGLSPWTIRRWAYTGKIASHKLGTRLMIPQSEIDRLITESERPRLEAVAQ